MNYVQWKLSKEQMSKLQSHEMSFTGLGKARLTEIEREKWEDNKGEGVENSLDWLTLICKKLSQISGWKIVLQ